MSRKSVKSLESQMSGLQVQSRAAEAETHLSIGYLQVLPAGNQKGAGRSNAKGSQAVSKRGGPSSVTTYTEGSLLSSTTQAAAYRQVTEWSTADYAYRKEDTLIAKSTLDVYQKNAGYVETKAVPQRSQPKAVTAAKPKAVAQKAVNSGGASKGRPRASAQSRQQSQPVVYLGGSSLNFNGYHAEREYEYEQQQTYSYYDRDSYY